MLSSKPRWKKAELITKAFIYNMPLNPHLITVNRKTTPSREHRTTGISHRTKLSTNFKIRS